MRHLALGNPGRDPYFSPKPGLVTVPRRALVEKTTDADLLREMIGFTAQKLMQLEVGMATGAAWGEKSPQGTAQRNGYRDRDRETRAGAVELRVPKFKKGR